MAQRKTTRKTSGKTRTPSRSAKKSGPSRKPKTSTRKRACSAAAKSVGDEEVTIDRRRSAGRRSDEAPVEKLVVAAPKLERRAKVNRRRQIDPTTCERDYSDCEVEFMNALEAYKRKSGRMFPTCSEVLEVVRSLGYVRLSPADFAAFQATGESSAAWLRQPRPSGSPQVLRRVMKKMPRNWPSNRRLPNKVSRDNPSPGVVTRRLTAWERDFDCYGWVPSKMSRSSSIETSAKFRPRSSSCSVTLMIVSRIEAMSFFGAAGEQEVLAAVMRL